MAIHLYHVIDEETDDGFGVTDDFETALSMAREAARQGEVGRTILLDRKGFVIRHFVLQPDGQVAEEAID